MIADAGSIYTSINNALQLITPANVTNPIEFWLAFLLVLAILNTVLKRVSFFQGNENKNSRALTALIISFFAVTAAWVTPVLAYMSSTLAVTAMILVAILIIASLAGFDKQLGEGKYSKWLFVAAIIVLFAGGLFSYAVVPASAASSNGTPGGVGSSTSSSLSNILSSLENNPSLLGILVVALFVLMIGAYLLSSNDPSTGSGKSN